MERKKPKTSNTASNHVVLEAFSGMPLDVIFEIFGHLDPLDLLRLARTTKALRAILMSRSSLPLWKRVRQAYHQMSDGPERMSEPQYASLAFENICHGCGLVDNPLCTLFWNARLRSCRDCQSAFFVNKSRLKKISVSSALPRSLIVLLDVRRYHDRYSLKQAQSWLQQYASLSGSDTAEFEWMTHILDEDALSRQHISSYNSWLHMRQIKAADQRQRLRKEIEQALSIKLGELGWAEERDKMCSNDLYELHKKLFTKDPESFSQAWSWNGRSIVKYLKTVQEKRLAEEWRTLLSSRYRILQSIYDEYVHGLAADTLIPSIADVSLSPPVHAIVTDKRADFNVTRETFEKINLMQTLPSIISDWKTRLEDELIEMTQVTLSEPFTKDHLLLATTVFRCDACHINLFYPRVLVHHCVTPNSERGGWQNVDPTRCPAWNSSGSIKFNRDVHQAVVDIVNILGLDPKVVTTENMAARNSVLQCLECRKTRQGRMTMVWSRAIDHSKKEHNCRPAMIFWKVPGHQEQLTLQARLAELAASDEPFESFRMCGGCLLHPDVDHAPMPRVLPEAD